MPTPGEHTGAPAHSARRIRTLVVDDSAVMRRFLVRMLTTDPEIEVVGTARDGVEALDQVAELQPDLVTLDVEMPKRDGLDALRLIQAQHPRVRVIMCSSLTARGAAVTMDALLAGASDYVTKQGGSGQLNEGGYEPMRLDLLAKIGALFHRSRRAQAATTALPTAGVTAAPTPAPAMLGEWSGQLPGAALPSITRTATASATRLHSFKVAAAPRVLAIGVSTGGPSALAEILPHLPAEFPLPVVIVQHMPPLFTKLLADRLTKLCRIPVEEGVDGMELRPGHAILAPGNYHMRLQRTAGRVVVQLDQREQENFCRPAVDPLFRSVGEVYGGAAVAMVLTGMGQDGLLGAGALRSLGAPILVQNSETSVVWGMPGAIANAGLADAVLPLQELIPELMRRL